MALVTLDVYRFSHLKIPGRPKMAHAASSRRAIARAMWGNGDPTTHPSKNLWVATSWSDAYYS